MTYATPLVIIHPESSESWRNQPAPEREKSPGEGRRLFLWLALAWCLGIGGAAQAQPLPGEVFKAFQFPDHLVPVIDGDLSDWSVVDDSYLIPTERFTDLVNGADPKRDPADFSVRLMVGWNKSADQLFVAARVVDDVHQIDRAAGTAAVQIFMDDAMEVFLDADHSGGQYADFADLSPEEQLQKNGAEASHFVIAGPPPDADFFVNFSAAGWYALPDGPYTGAAYALEGAPGGPSVMTYELRLVPFDHIDMRAPFLSHEHSMQEGQILGFDVEFDDFDHFSELLDAKWSLSGGYNAYKFSERFADLMLMPLEERFQPSAVQLHSWGRLKSSFAP